MPLSEAPRRDLKTAVLSILVGLVGEAHIVHVRFYSSTNRGHCSKNALAWSRMALTTVVSSSSDTDTSAVYSTLAAVAWATTALMTRGQQAHGELRGEAAVEVQ